MRKQTLKEMVQNVQDGKVRIRCGLAGCPVGGWPETQQAIMRLNDDLPHSSERSYGVSDLIAALYVVDHADRYQWRE